MPSASSKYQRDGSSVTVTFGESASGIRAVELNGRSYTALLFSRGYRETNRWYHGTPRLGVVAVKVRWAHPEYARQFTSFRKQPLVPVPLLNAAKVAKADEVWLSESHSDADALCAAGVIGTTNWQGVSDWNEYYADELRGKQLIVVQHRDEAGREFVRDVIASLPGEDITVVKAAVGNDARDHLEAGLSLDDFVEVV